MSDIGELLKSSTPLGIRVGMVTAVIDATHVAVDIGDRLIGASWPASLGSPLSNVDVTLVVGDGIARVITSSRAPAEMAMYAMASGSADLTFSGSTTASTVVTWPAGRFTVQPRWMAWLRTPAMGVVVATSNETLTDGRINGTAFAAASVTVSVGWMAWQRTPTSKD